MLGNNGALTGGGGRQGQGAGGAQQKTGHTSLRFFLCLWRGRKMTSFVDRYFFIRWLRIYLALSYPGNRG
jgi:hypothetical protein